MATKASTAAKAKIVGDFGLRLLVGLLFICIGIQGIATTNSNDLYRAIDNDTVNILLGILLLVCGLLIAVPLFIKGIKPVFTKYSLIIVSVVWILVIIFSDFVYGFRNIDGLGIFEWLEAFIYHLLILFSILKASKGALKGVVK